MRKPSHFTARDLHMGRIIDNRRKEIGMTKVELASRLCMSRQNVHLIIDKPCHNVELLWMLGQALDFDPFGYWSKALRGKFPDAPVELDVPYQEIAAETG
jgi:transcriptional regulator with XRE-family HTH domain